MTTSPEYSPGIIVISNRFTGILLDAYGVFWGGNDFGLLPGTKEAMEKLVLDHKIVGILSNSTQLAAKEINKLNRHGLIKGKHFHFLITSGEITRSIFLNKQLPFETPKNKYWLFGGVHPKFSSHEAIFQDTVYTETTDINDADFIFVSVPHIKGEDQIDPSLFQEEIETLVKSNLPMVCSNPDQFAHEGNPPKAVVRQGSIAILYEHLGGKVFYIGKPHKAVYVTAMNEFHKHNITNPSDILMVGDTPETDIRGARHFGISSALVTQTGIMADRISKKGFNKAMAELSPNDSPDYLIERLIDDFRSSL